MRNHTRQVFSGDRLREARGAMRREHLAVDLDVSVDTIRSWEAGRTEPPASKLAALARLTGRSLDFFFVVAA